MLKKVSEWDSIQVSRMRGLLVLILISCFGFAQSQSKAEVFVENDFDGGAGIRLKWIYEYVYDPAGFDVFRKEQGGSWEKINPQALTVRTSLPSDHGLNKDQQDLFTAVSSISFEELKHNIVRAFILIESIYSNELAEYIGISYHDKTAQKGKTYQYKIVTGSGTDLAESKSIVCGEFVQDKAPEEVKFFRKKTYVYCNWKPDLYRYYGVHVYKKGIDGEEFKKVTEVGPIALTPRDAKSYNEGSKFFVDTNITLEANYVYKLAAVDYFGQITEYSEEISVPAQDFTPPTPPYGFKLVPSSTRKSVTATWSNIDEVDLAGFNVYTSEDPEQEFVKVNQELLPKDVHEFVHEGVKEGGYYYAISTVDFAGNESFSGMMYTELIDRTPPEAPTNFKASAVSGEITLSWDANKEPDLKGYFIQKSLNDDNNLDNDYINVNAEPILETSFTEKLPRNIKNKFVYRVVAVDTMYNRSKPSINSLAQMPDVIPPNQPIISNASFSEGIVTVSWIPNADGDLEGYDLFRSIGKDTNGVSKININMIPNSITEYVDRNVEEGKSYYYTLVAKDNNGNSSVPSPGFKITIPKEKVELAIEVEKATYHKNKQQVLIQWIGPEGTDMRGYVIYKQDEYGTMKPISGLSEYTEFKMKLTTSEETAQFEIRGYTMNGEVVKTDIIAINKTN